jgi:hypothetical protein
MKTWLASKRGHADNLPGGLRKFNYDITSNGDCGPAAVSAALLRRYEASPDSIPDHVEIFNFESQRDQNLKELLAQIASSSLSTSAAVDKLQKIIRHHVAQLAQTNPDKPSWLAMLSSLEDRYRNNPDHLQTLLADFNYTSSVPLVDGSQIFSAAVEREFATKVAAEYAKLITTDREYVDHAFFTLLQQTLPIQLYSPHRLRPEASGQGFELQKLLESPVPAPINLFFVSFFHDESNGQFIGSQHYTLLDDAQDGTSFDSAYQAYVRALPPRP